MVAAGAAVSRHHGEALNPSRPPLIPSEKDNAGGGGGRRPRSKQITSRYLSSSSSTTSTSSSGTTTSSSSSGSGSGGGGARRCPSPSPPLPSRPSTPPTLQSRRSHSVGRAHPDPPVGPTTTTTTTTTRSLSVSFQGESFFYQTSKAKAKAASPKPTPERRRPSTPTRTSKPTTPAPPAAAADHSENSRPFDRWPTSRPQQRSNPLARSLDCSNKNEPILATVRLLQQSMVFDDRSPRRHSSFDAGDFSSDTDSVSSGSNSGAADLAMPPRSHPISRGVSVPARFWQETNSRLRRLPEPGTPLSSPAMKVLAPPKMASVKKLVVDSPVLSPRSVSSPMRGPIRHPSPSKLSDNTRSMRGMASPSRVRSSGMASTPPSGQPGNAPSIISFAAEVRRAKKGENRIEEAHMLRLLHNRQLQWRFMYARADAALTAQRMAVEKNLYNAWITTTGMRESVTIKRIKLQLLAQNLKLTSILKGQMTDLEEWSLMERDHSNSLSGATEALKGSILRLPVVDGARADLQEVKDAVGSAVDMMHAMGSSICSLLLKVEGTSLLVSELAKVASQEQVLLDKSRELLSKVAAMHVTQCSLRGHLLQLKRRPSQMQL